MAQQVAACELDCEGKPGFPVEEQLINWGEDIHNLMGKVPLLDLDRLVDVKEITQLIGVFFSSVLNKAMSVGWGFATSVFKSGDQQQRTRIEENERYAYRSSFKRQQTSEDRKDIRASTFANIQKSVKELSRSIIACTEDEMMNFEDYAKNVAEVVAGYVEGLYVGLEGLNLKPDFNVLDPLFRPYQVYGYSWGQMPTVKIPPKCKRITNSLNLGSNATCRWILSGLDRRVYWHRRL
ncbi:MAG: hypothetical protein ACTSQB_05175 [Candidatus Heimdallarchaeota archaeon]